MWRVLPVGPSEDYILGRSCIAGEVVNYLQIGHVPVGFMDLHDGELKGLAEYLDSPLLL